MAGTTENRHNIFAIDRRGDALALTHKKHGIAACHRANTEGCYGS